MQLIVWGKREREKKTQKAKKKLIVHTESTADSWDECFEVFTVVVSGVCSTSTDVAAIAVPVFGVTLSLTFEPESVLSPFSPSFSGYTWASQHAVSPQTHLSPQSQTVPFAEAVPFSPPDSDCDSSIV